MKTMFYSFGARLARRLMSICLLLLTLTLATQALARPTITSPASGTTLPSIAVGQSMSISITATSTDIIDQWFQCDIDDPDYDGVTPCLPPGLVLDPSPRSLNTTLHGAPTTAGTYTFSVSINDGWNLAGVATYTLVVTAGATPTLTSASPNTGSTAGGTSVTLTGTNLTGATAVSFGGTAASLFTVNDATKITATTPAHAAGAVNVVVSTPNGTATLTNGYTYAVPAPTTGVVSATVAANSSANPITLSLGGGAATSVAVSTAAAHGTATASGTSITYTPTSGYSGSDTFAYTATNASGTSSPATVTITVSAPTLALSPAAGALAGGTVGTAYSQTITATGGTAPYSYAITSGAVPAGLTLNTSTGKISGTPTASGTANFTVTATDTNGATGAAAYSLTISGAPPVASAVSATVAANSSANPITLSLSGGAATSVAVSTAAAHGTATASGTSITYTPTSGYSGSDTFAYTATNASGTSSPATVTITVSAPTLALLPAAGALAGGTVGTAFSQTITTSAGTAPYSYAITSGAVPAGLTLNTSTGKISGTPTASGTANFTVTATDTNGATGAAAYSLTISGAPPVASAVSATVAANSSANPITLSLSGGAATSVAVSTAAAHGTATASGTTITYTPTAGYSGSDSFTYTATNASGTSSPATVTITVSAPTLVLSPAAGALAGGTVGTAYSQTITATGGTAPYSYAITSGGLAPGLTWNAGTISGAPTASGTAGFTVTATDANGATGSAAYTIAVAAAPTSFVFSPAGGALTEAMAGEEYSQPISATGGTGTLIYSVDPGTLPDGMVLNISTGELTGPLAADTEGDYSFTIQVQDGNGSTGAATYTLKVKARAVTVVDQVVSVPVGSTPNNVNLDRGATGGPFSAAHVAFVNPADAGTATIIQGELAQAGPAILPVGWYLKFTPNPAYSGKVQVGFRLTGALGNSNTGTITYILGYDAAEVARDVDTLVHDFVQTRQNLIASTIKIPGLVERRQMAAATGPVTARMSPSADGVTLGFASSLAQVEAARNVFDGVVQAEVSPFNIWLDGTFMAHNREENGNKWGSFAMISLGADYLLSEMALLGLSFHYDRMTDPTDEDAELTGNGWLVGPYASLEIGKGVFWDTRLLYGGSSNTIDTQFWDGTFDTRRWLFDTSIKGQWNLDDVTVFTPELRAVYLSETGDDYAVENSAGDSIDLKGFTEEQLRMSLGAGIARQFTLENGMTLTPKLGGEVGFSGLDGPGLFSSVSAGLSLEATESLLIDAGMLFDIEGDGAKSVGAKVGVGGRF
ncbi:putative Ig domain-containing protein [Mesorhizobium sp. ANAO-SY3R2]|uniref:putative Ig domain-containing protein n=1 Tax=Mesorhizobium sp. ANAO-SY3R2 TaxID=3166644 RepID=UPI003672B160